MSTRSRAAPWFLERPHAYERYVDGFLSETLYGPPIEGTVESRREWSWNGRDWFDFSGNVVEQAPPDTRAVLDLVEREAKAHYEHLGSWFEGYLS